MGNALVQLDSMARERHDVIGKAADCGRDQRQELQSSHCYLEADITHPTPYIKEAA